MKNHLMFSLILFCFVTLSSIHADEDIFKDYKNDMKKHADAKVSNIYSAWANNNAHLIIHKVKKGLVIDGAGDYADGKVHADGLGNIVVDKDARINGPIINNPEIKNTTVVIKKDASNRTRY